MDKNSLQVFIDTYSSKDFDKVKFDWNGKYGDELIDQNFQFRSELLDYIIPQINTINILLVRDLYLELSKLGKEGWGAPKYFNILGQQLLLTNYKQFLSDYFEGASKSVDTYLDSGRINIPTDLAKEIAEYINSLLETETNDENKRTLNTFYERFKWLSENGKLI